MYRTRAWPFFALGCGIALAIYRATSAPAHTNPPVANFPILFPAPTGQNGYEEFVKASDVADASPGWREYEARDFGRSGPSLEIKRGVLADPMVQSALALVRTGLAKRIRSPRAIPELYTLVPELRMLRSVARMLCVEMHVLFADGKVSEAVECLNDGLRLGRSVQVGTLVSGVVGLYIENITITTFSEHLQQLSIRECDRLIRLANDHLNPPDPQLALVREERAMFLRSLRKYRANASELLAKLDPGPNASALDHRDYAYVGQWIDAHTDSGAVVFDQAAELVGAHFDQTLAQFRRPIWDRQYPGPVERESPAARLIYSLCPPSYSRMGERFACEQVRTQMLAVHAAVIRYRWHHRRLPGSLAELELGQLSIDPFTGASLGYRRIGERDYEFSSVGAHDPGDSKRRPTGQRVPITMAYLHPSMP